LAGATNTIGGSVDIKPFHVATYIEVLKQAGKDEGSGFTQQPAAGIAEQ
jgi:hypothetical protein